MKIRALLFILFLHLPALAVQAPTIAKGDYLFIAAAIVNCGPDVHTVEYGEVDAKGEVSLFRNISLAVEGKAVHDVVTELVDALEKQTGHRSKTIEIIRVSSSNEEEIARRLHWLNWQKTTQCPYTPKRNIPPPVWDYDYLIANK